MALTREEPRSPFRGGVWHVLGLAVIAQTGFSVSEMGVSVLTGFIKTDLNLSATTAGLLVSAFFVGKFLGSYAAGAGADALGEVPVLVGGGLLTGLLLLSAMSLPLAGLVVFLGLAGLTSAGATPAGGRLINATFAENRRGLAMGIRQTGIPLGGLLAAATLPWLANAYGWRWSVVAAGLITAAAVLPLVFVRRLQPDSVVVRRRPARRPINRDVKLLTVWGCLVVTGQYAILIYLPLDLHDRAGLPLAAAASTVAIAQATGIAGRILLGLFSDRRIAHGRAQLLVGVTVMNVVACLVLLGIPTGAPIGVWIGATALAGFALIGYQGLWITMVTEAADPDGIGAATGFAVTFAIGSVAVAPVAFGLAADLAESYRAVWTVLLALLILSVIPVLRIGRGGRSVGRVGPPAPASASEREHHLHD